MTLILANDHITGVSYGPYQTLITAIVGVTDKGWDDLLMDSRVTWNRYAFTITKITQVGRDVVVTGGQAPATGRRVQIEAEVDFDVRIAVESNCPSFPTLNWEDTPLPDEKEGTP